MCNFFPFRVRSPPNTSLGWQAWEVISSSALVNRNPAIQRHLFWGQLCSSRLWLVNNDTITGLSMHHRTVVNELQTLFLISFNVVCFVRFVIIIIIIIIINFISTTRVGIKYTFVSAITILLQILINCAGSTLFYSIALQYDYIIQFINSLFNRINL